MSKSKIEVTRQDFFKEQEEEKPKAPVKPKNPKLTFNFRGKKHTVKQDDFQYEGYYFDPEHTEIIQFILEEIDNGGFVNLLAVGASGSGKTEFSKALAGYFNINMGLINAAFNRNPVEWFGEREIVDGQTTFKKSHFAKIVEQDESIVHIDEINRTSERAANSLYTLLDNTRKVTIQDFTIESGVGKLYYATANIGYGFSGTSIMDKALTGRFWGLSFNKMSVDRMQMVLEKNGADEENAKKIAVLMQKIDRQVENTDIDLPYDISIRKGLQFWSLLAGGVSEEMAFRLTFTDLLQDEQKKWFQDLVNTGNY